jgi:hypothetical protein
MVRRQFTVLLRTAGVAGVVVAASLAAGSPASASSAPTPSADVTCPYKVAADWLRHRTTPAVRSDNALGQYARHTVVLAKRDVVTNGFRQLANGEWAAAAFLDSADGPCFS